VSPPVLQAMHYVLTALVALLLLSAPARWGRVWKAVEGAGPLDVAAVLWVGAAAFLLRWLLPPEALLNPNFHGMTFLDVPLCASVQDAVELADRSQYGVGNYTFYHFLWAYLPRTPGVYFMVNRVLSALTCMLLYVLVRLLGGNRIWAFASAWLLALVPAHVIVAASENSILLSSFLAMAGLVCWVAWLRDGSRWLLFGAAGYLLWTVHSRVLVLAFPAAFVITGAAAWPTLKPRLRGAGPWVAAVAFLLLAVPQYVHIAAGLSNESTQHAHAANLLYTLVSLIRPSVNLLINPDLTPVLVPVLSLAGMVLLARTEPRTGRMVAALAFGFGALYLFFSSLETVQLRYQYFTWPLWLLPAGVVPAWAASHMLKRHGVADIRPGTPGRVRLVRKSLRIQAAVTGLVLVAPALSFLPYVERVRQEDAGVKEFRFVVESLPQLPAGSVLLEPSRIEVSDRRTLFPYAIPVFLLEQTGVRAADRGMEDLLTLPDTRVVVYVGLQAYSYFREEDVSPYAPDYLRLRRLARWKGVTLRPLLTTVVDTRGYRPAEDLFIPASQAQIGFYEVEAGPPRTE